jgi:hypothetical protein
MHKLTGVAKAAMALKAEQELQPGAMHLQVGHDVMVVVDCTTQTEGGRVKDSPAETNAGGAGGGTGTCLPMMAVMEC